jgi:aminodeoxyfutalosine synthase
MERLFDGLFNETLVHPELVAIARKVHDAVRITPEEGILLYSKAETAWLGSLANHVRERINGDNTYYNRNIHIEPTNICIYNCTFCSYNQHHSGSSWELTLDDMLHTIDATDDNITEVHIVGGVHPDRDLYYYGNLVKAIKQHRPGVHIKAFTAIELDYMIRKSGMTLEEGLAALKEYGLDSIPGGGAEIFDEEVRKVICGTKSDSKLWLQIHRAAHLQGIPSNATILYGHVENYNHRIDHLERLRQLQDETRGFNAFIPLKFKNKNNELSWVNEAPVVEDLRNYAVSRIYLDNIPHLKAYWPMIGKDVAALSLSFGVDDLDGTINDSTRIYSMAGANDTSPAMTSGDLEELIIQAGRIPVERDSLYTALKYLKNLELRYR